MINKRILTLVFVVAFVTLIAGCFPTPPIEENQAPIIISVPGTVSTVGETYTYNVEAVDPDGDTLTYSLITKPTGMTITSATGLINWTPTAKGNYAVVVKVSDGVLYIIQGFTVVVSELPPPVNYAPIITSIPGVTATVGVAYLYDVNATDPNGDVLTYSLTKKPDDMTINSTAGLINWIPIAKGNYAVVVKVSDGDLSTPQSFTIAVEPGLIGIKVVPETMDLFERESEAITSVTANYSDGSTDNIVLENCSYESSHNEFATVTNTGLVTAVAPPSATITVSYTEKGITKTDEIIVTVSAVELDYIIVLPETMDLIVGDTGNIISVTAYYVDGFEANIPLGDCKYPSSDETVAIVSDDGVVTGVGEGIAIINVNYIGKSDPLEVTVNPILLTSIIVEPDEMDLICYEYRSFTVTAYYNDGSDADVTLNCEYESTEWSIAYVCEPGSVYAMCLNVGTAIITVRYTEGSITEEDEIVVTVI